MKRYFVAMVGAAIAIATTWLFAGYMDRPAGNGIIIDPVDINAGTVGSNSKTTIVYGIHNRTTRPVRIVGLGTC